MEHQYSRFEGLGQRRLKEEGKRRDKQISRERRQARSLKTLKKIEREIGHWKAAREVEEDQRRKRLEQEEIDYKEGFKDWLLELDYQAREKAERDWGWIEEKLVENQYRHNPDILSMSDYLERLGHIHKVENFIASKELPYLADMYGIDYNDFNIDSEHNVHFNVKDHFFDDRLPKGYGYKGGAARALLERVLGFENPSDPRDVDIIRLSSDEPYPDADNELARKYMPDDFEQNKGVEVVSDLKEYFSTRDLVINEVYATDKKIVASSSCVRDTMRGILRVSRYEREKYYGRPGPKILSKILRFYASRIAERVENGEFDHVKIDKEEKRVLERQFIPPFYLALQLDRSFEIGGDVPQLYLETLQKYNCIPDDVETLDDLIEYLTEGLCDSDFYFRYAPVKQFESEEEIKD